jgi:hypothetical protein
VLLSVSTGLSGYVVIGAIKGKVNPFLVAPPLMLTLVLLFLYLPGQISRVDQEARSTESEFE